MVPLLVTAVICSPLDRPYSAWYPETSTLTSAIDSTFICSRMALLPVSTAETPSIMMLFPPPPPIRVVPVTPGASEASAVKLRLAMGRFSTESVVTVNERSPLCVLTRAASLETWIVSVSPPTSTVTTPTSARSPALTLTPVRLAVLKPLMLTCSVYRSGGTLTNEKSPLALVNTSESCVPRVSLMSVTGAPGMTPPWGSLTVPATEPVVICAEAGTAAAHRAISAIASIMGRLLAIIDPSSCSAHRCCQARRTHGAVAPTSARFASSVSGRHTNPDPLRSRYTPPPAPWRLAWRKSCEES